MDQLNYNRMKKKEREAQKKLQPSETKPLWKNSKYDRTESRLKQWMVSRRIFHAFYSYRFTFEIFCEDSYANNRVRYKFFY